jgi:hypothetical protein
MQFQTAAAAAAMMTTTTTTTILLLDAIKYRSSSNTFFLALHLEHSLWEHIT